MSNDEATRIARAAHRLKFSRGAKIALPTAAALGAGAAMAIGSIPDGNGTITGCYATTGTAPYGSLRVIDPSLSNPTGATANAYQCASTEATITWNQRGPAGPAGPQGATGPQGTGGAPGAQGKAGASLLGLTTFSVQGRSSKIYLKLDGVSGEATDQAHRGDMVIGSFSLGGGGASKVSMGDISITKVVDKASPLIVLGAAEGKHYKGAAVSFARKAGGTQQDFLKLDLTNVIVSSYKLLDRGSSAVPEEQFTLRFTKSVATFGGHKGNAITLLPAVQDAGGA